MNILKKQMFEHEACHIYFVGRQITHVNATVKVQVKISHCLIAVGIEAYFILGAHKKGVAHFSPLTVSSFPD